MWDEVGLKLYDFHARQYDPQIGRFWGIDPADQFPSGYTGMGNDPGNLIAPDGCQVSMGGGGGTSTTAGVSGMSLSDFGEHWANFIILDDVRFTRNKYQAATNK